MRLLVGLLLLPMTTLAAQDAHPPKATAWSAGVGASYSSNNYNGFLSRWGVAFNGTVRRPGRKAGLEGLVETMVFPGSSDIQSAPCPPPPTTIVCSSPPGSGWLLTGALGVYARNRDNSATRMGYGAGLAVRTTFRPEGQGADVGAYFRLEYHPLYGQSGFVVGMRYYFFPGSNAGKHLIPLTLGVQF
ncbi:MAG: hypothetical protein ACYC2K_08280 [Gemmatimonadales bacterium]